MSSPQGPELWIVAGPNGAGKTTSVQREPISHLLKHVSFLNPDDLTKQKLIERGYQGFCDSPASIQKELFIEAANETFATLVRKLNNDDAVGIESVLSTLKYFSVVESVRLQDGHFNLIYIALNSPELAVQRVNERVNRGGHAVPEQKIHARWHRSLELLPTFAKLSSFFWVYDNSGENTDDPQQLIAQGADGKLQFAVDKAFPELARSLIEIDQPGSMVE